LLEWHYTRFLLSERHGRTLPDTWSIVLSGSPVKSYTAGVKVEGILLLSQKTPVPPAREYQYPMRTAG